MKGIVESGKKVVTAKSAGFCFGVKRAVDTVYEEVEKGGPIFTYGPVIHNESVISDLEKKGVRIIHSVEDLEGLKEGTVILRSHGVSRQEEEAIRATGLKVVDTTCPFVKRIHNTVARESEKGRQIVIIGAADHPEVEGIRGWSQTPAAVIATEEEAENFSCPRDREICVVSQTTFNAIKFEKLVAILRQNGYTIICVNTICNATHERQTEAQEIAAHADIMIVIGGKTSSNSAKLYEICRERCPKTFFIQTRDDLDLELDGTEKVIGITAGASTPKRIIEEVQSKCQNKLLNKC